MKRSLFTVLALVCTALVSANASAQPKNEVKVKTKNQTQLSQPKTLQPGQPTLRVSPPGNYPGGYLPQKPRLGFMGQMLNGYGMKVFSSSYGSPAQQAGLEAGDVIWRINGRRILTQFDYDQALWQSASNGGHVQLTVRNVRYDLGMSPQQFVSVHVHIPGIAGYPSTGPVQAMQYGGSPK